MDTSEFGTPEDFLRVKFSGDCGEGGITNGFSFQLSNSAITVNFGLTVELAKELADFILSQRITWEDIKRE